jgi:DNA invertase Pin-like site-specific DNA recombinase
VKNKIIGYIRVSTDNQSVENQKLKILEYAQLNKIAIEEFVSIEISTRKNQKQRKIDFLKEMLKEGDTLIVTELSRLGRNMLEILNLIEYFNSTGVKIIFTNQPELSTAGKNDALSTLLLSIYGYFAEAEREIISTRTKQGLDKARKNGKKLGRPKGTTGFSKLDGREEEIAGLIDKGLNNTAISKMLEISRPALNTFLKSREDKIKKYRTRESK